MKNRSSANKKMPAYPFVIIALVLFWFALESVGRTTLDCQRQEAGAINCRLAQSYRLGLLARQPELLADLQTMKIQKEVEMGRRRQTEISYTVVAATAGGNHTLPLSTELPWAFDQFLHSRQTAWRFTEFNWLAGLLFGLFASAFAGAGVMAFRSGGQSSFHYELTGTGPYKITASLLLIIALALLLAASAGIGRSTIHCQPPDPVDRNCRIDETHWLGLVAREPELLYAVQAFARPASSFVKLDRRAHRLSFHTKLNPPVMAVTPIGERQLPFSANLADEFDQLPRPTDGPWTYTEIQWLSGLLIALVALVFGLVGLQISKHLNTAPAPVEAQPKPVSVRKRARKR
jgi:hypothetical protein